MEDDEEFKDGYPEEYEDYEEGPEEAGWTVIKIR